MCVCSTAIYILKWHNSTKCLTAYFTTSYLKYPVTSKTCGCKDRSNAQSHNTEKIETAQLFTDSLSHIVTTKGGALPYISKNGTEKAYSSNKRYQDYRSLHGGETYNRNTILKIN